MSLPYTAITPGLVAGIKLIMTDVDGTLTSEDESIGTAVHEVIRQLQDLGVEVGLVSGRTLPGLDCLARLLGATGPIVAENGGVAKLTPDEPALDLGYSRQPALDALAALKEHFPDHIREREDNAERLIDVVFFSGGIPTGELGEVVGDVQLVDSGYILHLMEPGISKGNTLRLLLERRPLNGISPDEVVVFGDSTTDASLFELFPHTVLIPNPRLPTEDTLQLTGMASFASEVGFGEGFVQVAGRILHTLHGARTAGR
jgi:hydroxymethylpyrimidine pyrophosphatase-like HAD family hydrolase